MNLILKLIVVAALSTISTCVQSQSNLEFVETTTIELSGTTSTNFSVATLDFVVPEGQTWKIESVRITRKSTSGLTRDYLTNPDLKLILDDNLFFINSSTFDFEFPYWLKSGNHNLELLYTNTWSTSYVGRAVLSVLVFNIVQE